MNVRQFKAIRCSLRHYWQVAPVSSSHGKSSASDAASRTSASQGLTIRQFHPQGSLCGRGSIRGLTLLQNDLHIAILGGDSVVKLFNRFTLTLENAIKCAHDFDVNAMAFNQSGELLVTCRCVGMCYQKVLSLLFSSVHGLIVPPCTWHLCSSPKSHIQILVILTGSCGTPVIER